MLRTSSPNQPEAPISVGASEGDLNRCGAHQHVDHFGSPIDTDPALGPTSSLASRPTAAPQSVPMHVTRDRDDGLKPRVVSGCVLGKGWSGGRSTTSGR